MDNILANEQPLLTLEINGQKVSLVSEKGVYKVKNGDEVIFESDDFEVSRYIAFGW